MPAAPTHAHAHLPLPLPLSLPAAASAPAPARVPEHPFMQGAPPALVAPLRFQSPVTPQNHAESTAGRPRPRAASIAPLVKWDSDRKRRQGYFSAVDDGDEKSPFRHYTTGD